MLKDRLDDYSRQSICEKLQISRGTLNNWEKYQTTNVFKYLMLCELLEIDPFQELANYRNLSKKNSIDN